MRTVKATCKKCGQTLTLDIGDLTREKVIENLKNTEVFDCPDYHIELGPMSRYVEIDWMTIANDTPEPMTEKEWVESLQAKGNVVIDGGSNKVEELNLKSIHSIRSLEHRGFGFFDSDTHRYDRADSPRGVRYYIEVEKVKT